MNLYILNEVLYDYTDGMCVIAAKSLSRCGQLFMQEFASDKSDYGKERMQKEFNEAAIKVIENIPHEKEEVVSYVYGGG
jgi:23S rRNA U2552 (ribose-2'-O)-methylase RlmE/FtsJ